MDGEDAYGCKIKVDFVENWKERESMTIEANSKDTESVKKNHAGLYVQFVYICVLAMNSCLLLYSLVFYVHAYVIFS